MQPCTSPLKNWKGALGGTVCLYLKRRENGVPPLTREARTGNCVGSCRVFCSEKETKKVEHKQHLLKGTCYAKLTVIVRLCSNSLSQKAPSESLSSKNLSDWNSPASKLRIASKATCASNCQFVVLTSPTCDCLYRHRVQAESCSQLLWNPWVWRPTVLNPSGFLSFPQKHFTDISLRQGTMLTCTKRSRTRLLWMTKRMTNTYFWNCRTISGVAFKSASEWILG